MVSVQSSIRVEISRGACPVPKGAEIFAAYAIASAKGLIPEMENAAHLTLGCCMTFTSLGERLRLFEGRALRNLVDFRKRCGNNLIACLDSFLDVQLSGRWSIWIGCPEDLLSSQPRESLREVFGLPRWLYELFTGIQKKLKIEAISHPLDIHSRIRQEYVTAFQNHAACSFCSRVNETNGLTYCAELENKLAQALNKVPHSLFL